jgi:D-arabinose 1-dehydrogenase-like Zn-dependent alcohol dehydrogenase
VISRPGATEYRDIADPIPGPGEVRLAIRYAGLCGSDLATFRGLNPLVSYPRIPGHEVSGVVSALGPEVEGDLEPGIFALAVPYTSCGECTSCRRGRPHACRNNQTLGVQRDGALTQLPQDRRLDRMIPAVPCFSGHYGP